MTYQDQRGGELTLVTGGRFTGTHAIFLNHLPLGALVKEPGGRTAAAFLTIDGTRHRVHGEGTALNRQVYVETSGSEVARLHMQGKTGEIITSAGHRFTVERRLLPAVTIIRHDTTGTEICRLYRRSLLGNRKIILNPSDIDQSELGAILAALCFETARREHH
jgi:hypothetical protein